MAITFLSALDSFGGGGDTQGAIEDDPEELHIFSLLDDRVVGSLFERDTAAEKFGPFDAPTAEDFDFIATLASGNSAFSNFAKLTGLLPDEAIPEPVAAPEQAETTSTPSAERQSRRMEEEDVTKLFNDLLTNDLELDENEEL